MLIEIGWKLRVLRAMELYNAGIEGVGKMTTAAIDSISPLRTLQNRHSNVGVRLLPLNHTFAVALVVLIKVLS